MKYQSLLKIKVVGGQISKLPLGEPLRLNKTYTDYRERPTEEQVKFRHFKDYIDAGGSYDDFEIDVLISEIPESKPQTTHTQQA